MCAVRRKKKSLRRPRVKKRRSGRRDSSTGSPGSLWMRYETVYDDRYAMKNTMNFYGLVTLSLGRGIEEEGDVVLEQEDSHNYKRAILRDGKLDSILLQGSIDYSGIYQYLIKHKIDLSGMEKDVFHLSFADFYGVKENGGYCYQDQA